MNIYNDGEGERERERKAQAVYHVLLLLYFVRPFLALYVICIYIYKCVCVCLSAITRRRYYIIPRVRRIRSPNFSSRIRSNTIIAHSCISSACILCYLSTDILLLNYTAPTYIIVPNSIRKI